MQKFGNYKAQIDLVCLSKEEVDKVQNLLLSEFSQKLKSISVQNGDPSPSVHFSATSPFWGAGLTKKTSVRDDYRYAHFHLATPGNEKTEGRVTLAMETEGDIVHVGLAFCSNRDQYVRAKGRELASERCKQADGPYFYFEHDADFGTITEQAADNLIDYLGDALRSNDPNVPHWVKKKSAIMVYFPSEVENGVVV